MSNTRDEIQPVGRYNKEVDTRQLLHHDSVSFLENNKYFVQQN